MEILSFLNSLLAVCFSICYAYQFFYIFIALFFKKKKSDALPKMHHYAILICARNEENVIGDLLQSIHKQTYPKEYLHPFVLADNCTDATAQKARQNGAKVYVRNNRRQVGKGYALQTLLNFLQRDYSNGFDGYFVFDADNLLKEDYIERMNETFSQGHSVVTSYRNSKNYASNWISAGYALCFLRENRCLNYARDFLRTSCAVSGTGFLFGKEIAEEIGDWPFHTLTEDIEFTIYCATKGKKIAYCEEAHLYDEQPVTFRQSWNQRIRWSKGYLQVFGKYGKALLSGICKGNFSCFDMSMNILPAFVLTAFTLISHTAVGIGSLCAGSSLSIAFTSLFTTLGNMYITLFILGLLTTLREWKHIHASGFKKILYLFTFPIFLMTYLPISVCAMFAKTEWKPIAHTFSLEKMRKEKMVFFHQN